MKALDTGVEPSPGGLSGTKAAAEELDASYARLHTILEATSDLVLTVRRDWAVTYANGKALRSVPGLKLGADYWSCFPALLGTPAEQYQREAMAGSSEVHYDNFHAAHDRWYQVRVSPMEEGIAIFFSDVTEQKIVEDERALERMLREKRIEALSHMAGGLAHEISNPLAIIHGWAHDLKTMAVEGSLSAVPEVGTICDKILKTTDRATNILRGLRAFAREAAHDPLELASSYTILDQSLELQETRFARRGVEIRMELQADIPLFACREVQIGQIVTNLLNNAFDAIVQLEAGERWVLVRASSTEEKIQLEVIDSGAGIGEQFKAHLMEPFFTTKELGLGMGVGLSLSRAIAQDHGGTLTLVEEAEHTCFLLCLPLRSAASRQDAEAIFREASHETEQG